MPPIRISPISISTSLSLPALRIRTRTFSALARSRTAIQASALTHAHPNIAANVKTTAATATTSAILSAASKVSQASRQMRYKPDYWRLVRRGADGLLFYIPFVGIFFGWFFTAEYAFNGTVAGWWVSSYFS